MAGVPRSAALRVAVQTVLEYSSAGESQEEILRQFPMLEPEDISACLSFAGKLMAHSYSVERNRLMAQYIIDANLPRYAGVFGLPSSNHAKLGRMALRLKKRSVRVTPHYS